MVEAEVPYQPGLRPGSFARAEIIIKDHDAALAVPEQVPTSFAGIDKVLVVDGGKAVECQVERVAGRTGWSKSAPALRGSGGDLGSSWNQRRAAGHTGVISVQKLAEISIRRPVFAAMIILALVVVGSRQLHRLGVDRFPPVDLPTVWVAHAAFRAPRRKRCEIQVSDRSRKAVNTVEGIQELRSISGPGISSSSSLSTSTATSTPRRRTCATASPVVRQPARAMPTARSSPSSTTTTSRYRHARLVGRPPVARADRIRRQNRQGAARALRRRGRGGDRRRPRAGDQRLGGRRPAAAYGTADHRRARRRGAAEQRSSRGQRHPGAEKEHAHDGPHLRARRSSTTSWSSNSWACPGAHARPRPGRGRHQGSRSLVPPQRRADRRPRGAPAVGRQHRRRDRGRQGEARRRWKLSCRPTSRSAGDPRPVALHLRRAARDQRAPDPGQHPRLPGGAGVHAQLALHGHRGASRFPPR